MAFEQSEAGERGARRALVVGIARTPALERDARLAERFPALESAATDVDLVGTALRQSRYEVRRLHDVGGPELIGALLQFFSGCEPGDTALVYLSCHGETLHGRDYLLPADAQPGTELPDGSRSLFDRTLIPADPEGLLTGLPAGVTAVVCLDMCRTDGGAPRGDTHTVLSSAQDVFWLHSCGRGERAYADAQGGSWFGQALARALAPTTRPTTFQDVVTYTRAAVRATATDAALPPPKIEPYLPHGRPADAPPPVVCDGAQEAYRWTTMIEQSALWRFTSGGEGTHDRVRKSLGALVEHVVDALSGAGAHRDDPWADPTYPVRVVEQLSSLVERARLDGRDLLSPAETAVLLAAPVVHEGAVAIALEELHRIAPERLDSGPPATDDHAQLVMDAAQDVCRAHSQMRRTAATLRRRGLKDRATAADHWLRHRFIAEWDLLWERTGAYPALDRMIELTVAAVAAAAQVPAAGQMRDETRLAIDGQLRQVLGHLTVRPSISPRINDPGRGDEWNLYPPVPGNGWRAPDLARLLWTAALLAADPRRLSSVVVDHLGAHEPLAPTEVIAAISADFGYDITEFGMDDGAYEQAVRFACPHPALHVAVEELAARADTAVHTLYADWHKQRTTPPALLRGFPSRVTGDQLVPLAQRYQQPLERFRLAEDEIRPLLMGTQLYGDRMLSVRELYQNALDACRYRDMRRQYGATQGRRGPDWSPEIRFTQGVDEEGRPYIECYDNGSGMTRAKLTSMFARAGKRYEQDPEFIQERRNWRRAGLREMPLNSRFGIGVFSYFMLAEEVVVWTNPVDHYGRPTLPQPLRADIQSGSGLLRIGEDPRVSLEGGTRVRLYLGEDEERPPSLVETLESLLWVADFEVTAIEYAVDEPERVARRAQWSPGELRPSEEPWFGQPARGGPDVWLVQGSGRLLLDGVLLKNAEDVPGYICNLRERHSPEPHVDRNRLQSYDEEAVERDVLASVPTASAQWDTVSLNWLWDLPVRAPLLAVAVLDELPATATAVVDPSQWTTSSMLPRPMPLARVGCLPFDRGQLDPSSIGANLPTDRQQEERIIRWWQGTRLGMYVGDQQFLPSGYPEPSTLDAVLFQGQPSGWDTAFRAALSTRRTLGDIVRGWRRYSVAGFDVPGTDDIRALRRIQPDPLTARLHLSYGELSHDAPRHAPLLTMAAEFEKSLGEMCQLLEELRRIDPRLPEPPDLDEGLAAETPTTADAYLLARFTPSNSHCLPSELWPTYLLQHTGGGPAMAELVERAEHFAPLGWSVPVAPPAAAREHRPLDGAQRLLLSRDHDGLAPWIEGDYSLSNFLARAARLGVSPAELSERMREATAATVIGLPSVPEAVADRVPSSYMRVTLDGIDDADEAFIGPWEFVLSVRRDYAINTPMGALDLAEAREDLQTLDACGLLTAECSARTGAVLRQLSVTTSLLHRAFNPTLRKELYHRGVTVTHLVTLAATEGRPLGAVRDQLAAEERHLPLHIAPIPAAAEPLLVTDADRSVLVGGNGGLTQGYSIGQLLSYASSSALPLGPALARLAMFSVLGAATPPGDFTGPDAEALADFAPDDFDLAAFDAGLLGPGTLGPLELIRVAGRFGWSVGETYERYVPFRCLALDVTVDAPDETEAGLTPDWRDVIVLTEQLTGRAPVLSGLVDPDHIALCAEETDLTEAGVRERLTSYARLFNLTLPPEEGQAP